MAGASEVTEAFPGADALAAAWYAGLAPDPFETVSEWADKHRMLSSRAAAEAGPYQTSRTPFMRAIMDALSPGHRAQRVVFMKSAQVGATEAGNNWIGFTMHRAPGPFLAVQPTVDLAKRLSQQRIDPLIEDSPVLRDLLRLRSRDSSSTLLSKRFPGGQLILTGANSAVGLRSMPARYVFLDEVDAYPGDVDGEGDPISLAEARTNSFGHRSKLFLASTPTVKGLSRIEREYEMSDQQRYHIPCPLCGGLQWLKFERLRWTKGKPETVLYICEHCEEGFSERHKTSFMDEAHGACWLPTADDDMIEAARSASVIGFHISGLYSPLGWLSWSDIARKWEAAQGNASELKTVKNTVLGETWQESGEAPEWQRIYDRREVSWSLGQAPEGVLLLTAGADVQRDRIEIDVWGWGRELRSWLVDHVVIEGDTAGSEVWDKLSEFLGATWPHASGAELALARLAIDTGDGVTTNAVYSWVRAAGRGQVIAVKGVEGFDRATPVDGPTYVEVTEGGRKLRRGVQLWKVAVAVFKSETYRYLRLDALSDEEIGAGAEWPKGYMHVAKGTPAEWVKQLTSEQLMSHKTRLGHQKLEWQKTRDRNEALDCRVYARAASWLIGIDRWDNRRWEALEEQLNVGKLEEAPAAGVPNRPVKKKAARGSNWMGSRRGKWF